MEKRIQGTPHKYKRPERPAPSTPPSIPNSYPFLSRNQQTITTIMNESTDLNSNTIRYLPGVGPGHTHYLDGWCRGCVGISGGCRVVRHSIKECVGVSTKLTVLQISTHKNPYHSIYRTAYYSFKSEPCRLIAGIFADVIRGDCVRYLERSRRI